MTDREAFDTALNLAVVCGVTRPLGEYREAGKPIPEETVSVGNWPTKAMKALVDDLVGVGQPVQRRGRGRPFRNAGDAPPAEQAEHNAAWLAAYILKELHRQNGRERLPGEVKREVIGSATDEAAKAFGVPAGTIKESNILNLLKSGRIVVPSAAASRVMTEPKRERGRALRQYEAALQSGWEKDYEGAIKVARAGDVKRLVNLLRAHRPLGETDFDLLAYYAATAKRKRGRTRDEFVHKAARFAEAFLGLVRRPVPDWLFNRAIEKACEQVDYEDGIRPDREKVRDLLKRPKARRHKPSV
jgi:hypothetical protein